MQNRRASVFCAGRNNPAGLLLSLFLLLPVGRLGAQTETLSDGNSSVTLNLTGPGAGMDSWMVDGQNQLNLQWFYFRAGSTATAAAVGSLLLLSAPVQPTAASLNTPSVGAANSASQVVACWGGGAPGSGTA